MLTDPDYLKFLENQKKLESDSIPAPEVYLQEIEAREKELKGTYRRMDSCTTYLDLQTG